MERVDTIIDRFCWVLSGLILLVTGVFSTTVFGFAVYGYGHLLLESEGMDVFVLLFGIVGVAVILLYSLFLLTKLLTKLGRSTMAVLLDEANRE